MPGYESLLRDDMDFPVELFVQDTDAGFARAGQHWHDCFELLYMRDGEVMQWVNGRSFLMRRGDLLLLRSGDIHATSRCSGPARILVLKFMPGVLNARYARSFQSPFLAGYLLREPQRGRMLAPALRDAVLPCLLELEREYLQKRPGYEYFVRSGILRLIGTLTREGTADFTAEVQADDSGVALISRAAAYMETHYHENLRLSDLAAHVHLSEAYLSRCFKRVTGRNYKQYLDYIRAANVTLKILREGMNVTQAAAACGYSGPQAMTRAFVRLMGFPPSHLKRKMG